MRVGKVAQRNLVPVVTDVKESVVSVDPFCPLCDFDPCLCGGSDLPGDSFDRVVSMVKEIDSLFSSRRAELVSDLVEATTEYSRSRMFVAMCDAVKGLG